MIPIWCPQNMFIKFRVVGKWRIDKLHDYTDSKGLPSSHSIGFNYGSLVGRIGKEEKFIVADETAVLVKKEGPLFLRQNLPKRMQVAPEGKLEVSIYDGIYMSIEEINYKIGWFENGTIDDNNQNQDNNNIEGNIQRQSNINSPKKNIKSYNEKFEKELEENLIIQFNNLRMNPSMFYEKYINCNTSLIWTKKFLDKLPKEGKNPLAVNEDCYDFLDEFFKLPKQINFKKNLYKVNMSENLKNLDEAISYFMCDQFKGTTKVKSKITQKDNPMDIIVQYLLDRRYRPFIFDTRSLLLVVKTFKNFYKNATLVIIAIILDKDYSLEESQ